MPDEMFATCPNCQNRMKLEFIDYIEKCEDFFNREKTGKRYEGTCLICNLGMNIKKPI